MEKKSLSINNKIISYTTTGVGEPVVLLHGFGEDGTVWENQVDYLRKNYQVIIPDIPGSGASDLTDDVSMEAIATIVKEITNAEETDEFVLIGHSMGGYATLAFAEKYPELLKGFGLFHSTASPDNDEKIATRKKGIEFILQHGAKAFLDTTIPNLFSEKNRKESPELIDRFSRTLPEFSNTALIEYYEAMIARPDRMEILKQSKIPVLFIFGAMDALIPLDVILKQASLPKVSDIFILNESGHMGMIEEPGKANAAIEEFLIGLK